MTNLFPQSNVDKKTAAQQRRDAADQTRQASLDRQANAEREHQARASVASEHVMREGLVPRQTPSFGESMASRMGLLADAMSGDVQAQVEYQRLGATKKEQAAEVKTKDVKVVDDLAAMLKSRLGPGLHKKQFAGPTTFAELAAEDLARLLAGRVEDLNGRFGMLTDNILADPDIADKAAAVQELAREYDSLLTEAVATKGLGGRRRAKALVRKTLVTKGLTW